MSYVLGIDYGTSATCAAISADGRTELLRIEGQSHFPSHVHLGDGAELWTGASAGNAEARAPERFARAPKWRLGLGTLMLGDRQVDPVDAVAAVLRKVLEEAMRHEGGQAPAQVRLTYPAAWLPERRSALAEAAARAGIASPALVSEPEAAAYHFAASARVEIGALLAVYDLGAGTFDTAVLRCTAPGVFKLAGPAGGTAVGGDAFDRHVFERFGEQIAARDPAAWAAIEDPQDRRHRQARRILLSDARQAKETLSSLATADAYVERVDAEVQVDRAEFERLIAADLERTLTALEDTLLAAGAGQGDLAALLLIGGSSRVPLVEQRVRERFGRADSGDDAKAVVALGAAAMPALAPSASPEPVLAPPVPPASPKPALAPPAPSAAPRPVLAQPPAGAAEPPPVAERAPVPPLRRQAAPARGARARWLKPRYLVAVIALVALAGAGVAAAALNAGDDAADGVQPLAACSRAMDAGAQTAELQRDCKIEDYVSYQSAMCDWHIAAASGTSCEFAVRVFVDWAAPKNPPATLRVAGSDGAAVDVECSGDFLLQCNGSDDTQVFVLRAQEFGHLDG